APKQLTLTRDGDRTVWLGETATVRLTIHNGSVRPFDGRVRDAWVPSAGAAPYAHNVRVEPGARTTVETTLTPTRPGDRSAVRVTLRAYGPLRFGCRQTRGYTANMMNPEWSLRVYPRFASRRFLPEKIARLRVFDGAVVTRGRGQGTEFDALREYVVG